ncbi:type VI secretion system contractile sheath large subunit [Ketobacter sp. MCCC 1A13808]|uniref:type VI secretion system contractile sheath large subunit n=1 Tax=Ketobacter sp. MCCC 1A13808 TaxID=2602738 RepID=UPI000F27A379|nr:type VI secretion system contractile sheath large subunit [Ketobacter sp. MCCC 1A13808]MVF10930.1 type VI secretion system contractile sheath large subunit [Ketobacter sp. MCCC 1A13808]RLP56517.1 MAG: type VI secretion system contractile sheath large subunit [Ketobacter sp.]
MVKNGDNALEVTEGSLLDQIVSQTKMMPGDEGYEVAKRGVGAFIAELLRPENKEERVNKNVIDRMIDELDVQLSAQMDDILHTKEFKNLESAWRGLKMLVDRTDFTQNIKIEMINASKQDLYDDFEDAPDITKSGLYKLAYTAEYGQFGGEPVGAIIANYDFGPNSVDMKTMQSAAAVSAVSHAPFIAAAGPKFFGLDQFDGLPNLKELSSIFEGPQFAKWRSFRESEDAKYVGLTLPRFLLRAPYDPEENPSKGFNYRENVSASHEDYLWGNTAFAFGTRLTDSFAKYRWCPNVIGPKSGGAVEDLPVHLYESMGDLEAKVPTEVLISDRREYELSEEGFIPLTMRKGSDNAAFFSANSVQKPKYFGNDEAGKAKELNFRLSTQLPYMFIVNRLAHYLKVLQRENIGSWKERVELQQELNNWISSYIADQENPSAAARSRRPLRAAKITVDDVPGQPGIYRVNLNVRPHFKYMGADFELSLVGKLEKS